MSGVSVLFVLTSHGVLGTSGDPTGWYLPEVAHPYTVLSPHFNITFASPKGGKAPMDPSSLQESKNGGDTESLEFLQNSAAVSEIDNTLRLDQVNPADYKVVFFAGGHGPMFDLVDDKDAHNVARAVYEAGGILGAVCHGTIGLANLRESNGKYLVAGKKVAGFTNSEEDAVDKTKYMPVLLQDVLVANGAEYSQGPDWAEHVVVDGRLVTGQNPASAKRVAEEILKLAKP